MFNLVVLTGRLTADPELKTTPSGISVTRFSVAVQRNQKNADGEYGTDFINVVAWRQKAEFVSKYFSKGSMIGIEGSIQTGKYTDKNGNSRTSFDVVANNVQFVESKRDSSTAAAVDNNSNESFSNASANDFTEIGGGMDDDLPF